MKRPRKLSPRQREVVRLMAAGLSYPKIAERMGVTLSTVKAHADHLFLRLGVNSKEEAIAAARSMGEIQGAT